MLAQERYFVENPFVGNETTANYGELRQKIGAYLEQFNIDHRFKNPALQGFIKKPVPEKPKIV